MSKYTTELRFICENYAGLKASTGFSSVDQVIANSMDNIFSFYYPFWDETKREDFQRKFLLHFYTREIGFETVGLWKMKLEEKLNLIMPYYNALYKALDQDFNPLEDTDLKTVVDGWNTENEKLLGTQIFDSKETTTGGWTDTTDTSSKETVNEDTNVSESGTVGHTVTNSGSDTVDTWRKINDTPQGAITGLEQDAYLTSAEHDTEDTTLGTVQDNNEERDLNTDTDRDITTNRSGNTSTVRDENRNVNKKDMNNINNTTDTTIHTANTTTVKGKSPGKSYAQMIKEYIENVRNIDEMVFNELNELFMLVY